MEDARPLRFVTSSSHTHSEVQASEIRFGRFELRIADRLLLVDGQSAKLQPRSLDLLITLARRPGRLQTRQQLLDAVWPGLNVEENNLSVHVNALRRLLGSQAIATVPGRGYRFTPELERAADLPAPITVQPGDLRPSGARPAHLPRVLAPLIGRNADLQALGALMLSDRLVTITGGGGMGKTRLAQAVLHACRHDYLHGVCFVELASATPAEAVPEAVAAALGIRLPDGDDPCAALARSLASLTMLMVLDNAEHLISAVAALAQALLDEAPGLRMLVTSQVRLGLAQETVYQISALAVPASKVTAGEALGFGAVALFVARARALNRHFMLADANVAHVIQLCRQLDGSPLAIGLAATRLSVLGLPRLVESMGQRLSLLTQGHRGAPPRQQTLRAALEWSHELLSPAERVVFRRMAVFVGSSSLSLVQQVVADEPDTPSADSLGPWEVLEGLSGLVDRSLVSLVFSREDESREVPRYRLLDSPQALALERLQAAGELDALQRRHSQALRRMLDQAYEDVIHGRSTLLAMQDALETEHGNALAALRWALAKDPAEALAIGPVLALVLGRRRHTERVSLWRDLEPLLDLAPGATDAVLARAGWQCAEYLGISRPLMALARARQALAFAVAAGDGPLTYLALTRIAHSHWRMGDGAALREAVDRVQSLNDPGWSPYVRLSGVAARAWLCVLTHDQAGALRCFTEQAELSVVAGIDNSLALMNIARIHLDCGQTDSALQIARDLVERFGNDRNHLMLAMSLASLVNALLAQARQVACVPAESRAVLRRLWPLACQFEQHPQWADAAAQLAALESRPRAALGLAGFADAAFSAMGQAREKGDEQRLATALQALRSTPGSEPNGSVQPGANEAGLASLRSEGSRLALDMLPMLAFAEADLPDWRQGRSL